MSAWIVSHNHIDTLVYWGMRVGLIEEDLADDSGQMLWTENLLSVAYRYPDDKSGERNGPDGLTDEEIAAYHYQTPVIVPANEFYGEGDPYNADVALVQLECYTYQSCEHPEWQDSWAFSFCESLRKQLTTQTAGVDLISTSIPWGI